MNNITTTLILHILAIIPFIISGAFVFIIFVCSVVEVIKGGRATKTATIVVLMIAWMMWGASYLLT